MNEAKQRRNAAADAKPVSAVGVDGADSANGMSSDAPVHAYSVSLPSFEGPLDLLLHLCQKHELDILEIPIGFITEKYLEYLAVMTLMNLDLASEYLVMAATLAHIKSKSLLPQEPAGQEDEIAGEEEDPREALIRRLLEYQKYKRAGEDLQARGVAGRDIFLRGMPIDEAVQTGLPPLAQVPLFSLVEAFQAVLAKSKVKISHDIVHDGITLADRINELVDVLRVHRRIAFEDLFKEINTRFDLVITFLALLEMTRLRMTRLFQTDIDSGIFIEFSAAVSSDDDASAAAIPAPVDEGAEPVAAAEVEVQTHAHAHAHAHAHTAHADGEAIEGEIPDVAKTEAPPAFINDDEHTAEEEVDTNDAYQPTFVSDTEPPPSAILADDAPPMMGDEVVFAEAPEAGEADEAPNLNEEESSSQTIPAPPPAHVAHVAHAVDVEAVTERHVSAEASDAVKATPHVELHEHLEPQEGGEKDATPTAEHHDGTEKEADTHKAERVDVDVDVNDDARPEDPK